MYINIVGTVLLLYKTISWYIYFFNMIILSLFQECCHSLSCLCSVLLKQKHMTDQVSTVEKIKDIFIQVLTKCRHRVSF